MKLFAKIIVIILKILVRIIFADQPIEFEKGAIKNNKFHKIKLIIISVRFVVSLAINNHQRLIIKLYQSRI